MPKIRYNTHTHNKTPEPAEVCAPDVLKRFRMCVRKRGRGQFSSTQSSTVRSGSLVILQSLLGSSSTHPLELQRTRVRHIVSRLTLVGRGARGAFRSALADHHRTGQAHLRESDRASSRESATPRGGGRAQGSQTGYLQRSTSLLHHLHLGVLGRHRQSVLSMGNG